MLFPSSFSHSPILILTRMKSRCQLRSSQTQSRVNLTLGWREGRAAVCCPAPLLLISNSKPLHSVRQSVWRVHRPVTHYYLSRRLSKRGTSEPVFAFRLPWPPPSLDRCSLVWPERKFHLPLLSPLSPLSFLLAAAADANSILQRRRARDTHRIDTRGQSCTRRLTDSISKLSP